ncbi:MAG: hypothetical protein JEY79_06490 [Pseudodesulfovibrio sp.]|nr:hypothetical protein [Pseudodesulfovibrio sp.]
MEYWEFKEQYFVAYVVNQDMLSTAPEEFVLSVRGILFARNDPFTQLGAIEGDVLPVRDWPYKVYDLFNENREEILWLYEDFYLPYIQNEEEFVLLDLKGDPLEAAIDVLHGDGICYFYMQGLKEIC